MENDLLKVAVVQMSSFQGDFLKNREVIHKYAAEASRQKAEILITPELSNVGYNLSLLNKLRYNSGDEISYYSDLARKYNIALAVGMLEKEEDVLFNSLIVIDREGNILSKYRKLNLFPVSGENTVFRKGNHSSTFSSGNFKMGLSICYDIRFPELFRTYLENGCNVIIVASAFPFPRLEHWQVLLKAHAIMNQSYILASNRTGMDNDLRFLGHSCIVDPWGNIVSAFDEEESGVLVETLDLSVVTKVRNSIPAASERLKNFPV